MIVAIAWIAAVVVGLIVLGFCAYEIRWKSSRLNQDLTRLRTDVRQLTEVSEQLAHAAAQVNERGPWH